MSHDLSPSAPHPNETRPKRWRVMVMIGLMVDAMLALSVALYVLLRMVEVDVWVVDSFPANMLMVKNRGPRALTDVRLSLDGRYEAEFERIPQGISGFEMGPRFRDESQSPPSQTFVPQHVELRVWRRNIDLEVLESPP